ncbi:MAG: hypothetical protein QF506_02060 [Candidatus Woesearchaeota archaeon]|jgi:hypothetical protein|nr:hypothetical protein [Candidatus Woesearchaeota archaeon]
MDTLEQIAEKREKLYIVPKPRVNYTYSDSRIDKNAYFAAKSKEERARVRESIYDPSYELSPVYKEFIPPKGFSKGSVEQCKNPNIYKITYGNKTIYRAMINDKAVAFSIDKEGNFRYVSKIIDESLRNQQHLRDILVEGDLAKVKNYVQRERNLIPENDIPYDISTHKPEKEEFKPGLVNIPHYRTKEYLEAAA